LVPAIWNKQKRSEVMSLIRSHGYKASELRLVTIFKAHSFTGWRRNQKLAGQPDFVLQKIRLCVFVDQCFWHACPYHATGPKRNRKFWDTELVDLGFDLSKEYAQAMRIGGGDV
jgi:DNA mismatch endonuclease (patch repair protein)